MECGEVREEFSAMIDGELAPEQRRAVEAHLTQCSGCLRELDRIKRIDVLYRGLAPRTAPIGFEEGINTILVGGWTVGSRLRAASGTRRRPRMRLWPRLLPVVVAAALLLVVLGATVLRTGRLAVSKDRMAQNATEPARVLADTAGQQEAMGLKGETPEAPRRGPTIAAEPAFQHMADKLAENAPTSAVREAVGVRAKPESDVSVQGLSIQEAAKPAVEPESKVMDKSGREEIEVSAARARAAHRLDAEPVLSAPSMPAPEIELSMPSAVAPETPAMAPPPPMSPEKASVAAAAPPPPPAPRAEARMAPVPSRVPALADGAPALEKAGEAGSQAHVAMAGPAAKTQEAAGRYVARGDSLREQGELTRAIENYKSALDLEPKNVDILVKLGETLLQNGKKKEALRQLQQAVKVEPRSVAAQCGLARALESAGRVDEAVEHLQKALEIDPSSAQAKEALERLKPAPKKP